MTARGAFVRAPVPAKGTDYPTAAQPDTQLALRHLLDAGVITEAEFQDLRSRAAK
jgi:hypothetical protein